MNLNFLSRKKALQRLEAAATVARPTTYVDGHGDLVVAAKGATYSWGGTPSSWSR